MRRVSPGGIHKPWLYLPNRMLLRQSLCEEWLKKHFNYLFLVICDHLIRMIIGSLFPGNSKPLTPSDVCI